MSDLRNRAARDYEKLTGKGPYAPEGREGLASAEERPARRRPPFHQFEGWIDRQIRQAQERGDFDNLPGKGKPLPGLDGSRDDDWWIKRKLKQEQLSYLPPALALRKEVEDARARIATATTEAAVRSEVAAINARIREVNSRSIDGPPSTQMPLDVESVVARWQSDARAG
jgi:hypothetical protein